MCICQIGVIHQRVSERVKNMIEPIFSSKLFAVSNRKAEIRATASNPVNQNLMQQLSSALDKSYQKAEYLLDTEDQEKLKQSKSADTESDVDETTEQDVSTENDGDENTSVAPKGNSAPPKPSNLHSKFKEAEKNAAEGEQDSAPTDDAVDTITDAATDIDKGIEDDGIVAVGTMEPKLSPDSLKDALNNSSETKGVSRTSIKDDELWIYYEDSINLNKVMADAIETIYTFGYGLEFNRLARSDNAIVFLIESDEN